MHIFRSAECVCVFSCMWWGRYLSEYTCLSSKLANWGFGFQWDLSFYPAGPPLSLRMLSSHCHGWQCCAVADALAIIVFCVVFPAGIEACPWRCPVSRGWTDQLSVWVGFRLCANVVRMVSLPVRPWHSVPPWLIPSSWWDPQCFSLPLQMLFENILPCLCLRCIWRSCHLHIFHKFSCSDKSVAFLRCRSFSPLLQSIFFFLFSSVSEVFYLY